jgi:hypothetical protein
MRCASWLRILVLAIYLRWPSSSASLPRIVVLVYPTPTVPANAAIDIGFVESPPLLGNAIRDIAISLRYPNGSVKPVGEVVNGWVSRCCIGDLYSYVVHWQLDDTET